MVNFGMPRHMTLPDEKAPVYMLPLIPSNSVPHVYGHAR